MRPDSEHKAALAGLECSSKDFQTKSQQKIQENNGRRLLSKTTTKKIMPHKDPLNTWNSAQCHMATWMGGEFAGEWMHVYVFVVYLKLSQNCLLISYTPIQNKKLKINEYNAFPFFF